MATSRTFRQDFKLTTLKGLDQKTSVLFKKLLSHPEFADLPRTLIGDLRLCLTESVTNAMVHGLCHVSKPVQVQVKASSHTVEMVVTDYGRGFNLAEVLRRKTDELNSSGRGLLIIKSLMDRVSYVRGRPNKLILVRELQRPKKLDAAIECFHLLNHHIEKLKSKSELYEIFIDFIVDIFNVKRASLFIFDSQSQRLDLKASRGINKKISHKISIQPGEGIAGYVFQTSRPMLVQNISKMSHPKDFHLKKNKKKNYDTLSFISLPIMAPRTPFGEETLGVLNLTDKRDGEVFTQSELKLLSVMAGQAASAFRICDLIETIRGSEASRKELSILKDVQESLLPDELPSNKHFALSGHCQQSPRGGGDYFDFIQVGSSFKGIIADVSGHSVGSVMTMATLRAIFRSFVYDPNSPAVLLRALRWAMHRDLIKLEQFISCWIFEYSTDGTLRVSGAGHPPIFLYRAKTQKWHSYFSMHLPLGLEDDTKPFQKKIFLEKGDYVFLYTDGLFDPRMRETGFDKQNFFEMIENNLTQSPQELIAEIFSELSSHRLMLKSPDDVALLALRQI